MNATMKLWLHLSRVREPLLETAYKIFIRVTGDAACWVIMRQKNCFISNDFRRIIRK